MAPLLVVVPWGIDGERRLGDCWREGGGWTLSGAVNEVVGIASSIGVGSAVVVDMRGERGVLGVEAAEETAVLFPLRKKFTLNPGTTIVTCSG